MAEMGVCFGGTLKIIADLAPEKTIYGFDTFAGLPEMGTKDAPEFWEDWRKGNLVANYDKVKMIFDAYPNVKLIKGLFPDTTMEIQPDEKFCFVHVDGDLYRSTVDAIDYFLPRLTFNGVLLFDDYRYRRCPGVTTAIAECVTGREGILHKPVGSYQYLIQKVTP